MSDIYIEVLKFLVHRDRMNAAVHCGEVRWSPLTEGFAIKLQVELGYTDPLVIAIIDGSDSDE